MNVFDVTAFGAVGGGKSCESLAVQRAIDTCHAAGGGTVTVPAGDYRIGTIELKSGVTLRLERGAALRASDNAEDYRVTRLEPIYAYRYGVMISAKSADRIGLEGEGTVCGFGTETFGKVWGVPDAPPFRVGTCLFEGCSNVSIRDVTFRDSEYWTVHLLRCDTVHVQRVTIMNFRYRLNTDGIGPDASRNVWISDCRISAGDDGIVLKSTTGGPCENVFISNCVLESPCTAIKLGTESFGDFRNIHVADCTIVNSAIGIGLFMKDGGTMERICFRGITIENADLYANKPVLPIFADVERRHADSAVGTIRDVSFRDIAIDTNSSIALQGMPESPLHKLTLHNITMRIAGAIPFAGRKKPVTGRRTFSDERDTRFMAKPAYIVLAYARDADVDNVRIDVSGETTVRYPRHAVYAFAAPNLRVRNVRLTSQAGAERQKSSPDTEPVLELVYEEAEGET